MTPYQICSRQRMDLKIMLFVFHRAPAYKPQRIQDCPGLDNSQARFQFQPAAAPGAVLRGSEDLFSFDAIAVSASRDDELVAQFFADVGNVNVQQIRQRGVVLIEKMLVKRGARDDFAAMQREEFHE